MLPLASALATALTSSSSPPHICYILADDLGWNDIGYHNSRIQSPHIDALAHGGLMLDQFYVQLVCSPSRAAIMTGKYPFRLGLSHGFIAAGAPYGLPLDEVTVAQELHDANYATAIVGKWHLGMASWPLTPTFRGFDQHYGFYNGAIHYFAHTHPETNASCPLDLHYSPAAKTKSTPITNRNGSATLNISDYGPFLYSRETVRMIEAHAAAAAQDEDANAVVQPMFLYLTHQSTHEPIDAPASYIAKYAATIADETRRTFAGMVTALDDAVEEVVVALKAAGFWENTLLIFHADNGGNLGAAGNNLPLRGGKFSLFEGGTRVVAFLAGGFLPTSVCGTTSNQLMHEVDIYPTLLALAKPGATPKNTIDGVDQWQALTTPNAPPARTGFIYNIDSCAFNNHGDYANFSAIRMGDWKYIDGHVSPADEWKPLPSGDDEDEADADDDNANMMTSNSTKGPWLFNLKTDPTERTNLLAVKPTKAAELKAALDAAAAEATAIAPFNCKGSPGAIKAPQSVTCPGGIWTPWVK